MRYTAGNLQCPNIISYQVISGCNGVSNVIEALTIFVMVSVVVLPVVNIINSCNDVING